MKNVCRQKKMFLFLSKLCGFMATSIYSRIHSKNSCYFKATWNAAAAKWISSSFLFWRARVCIYSVFAFIRLFFLQWPTAEYNFYPHNQNSKIKSNHTFLMASYQRFGYDIVFIPLNVFDHMTYTKCYVSYREYAIVYVRNSNKSIIQFCTQEIFIVLAHFSHLLLLLNLNISTSIGLIYEVFANFIVYLWNEWMYCDWKYHTSNRNKEQSIRLTEMNTHKKWDKIVTTKRIKSFGSCTHNLLKWCSNQPLESLRLWWIAQVHSMDALVWCMGISLAIK